MALSAKQLVRGLKKEKEDGEKVKVLFSLPKGTASQFRKLCAKQCVEMSSVVTRLLEDFNSSMQK